MGILNNPYEYLSRGWIIILLFFSCIQSLESRESQWPWETEYPPFQKSWLAHSQNQQPKAYLPTFLSCDEEVIFDIDTTICQGDTIRFFDQEILIAGFFEKTLECSADGGTKDSIIFLNVTVVSPKSTVVQDTICNGTTYTAPDGSIINNSVDSFAFSLTSSAGCDSLVILILEVLALSVGTENGFACEGDVYNYYGQTTDQNGNIMDSTGVYLVKVNTKTNCTF